ncbi:hypothetical protein BX616_002440 [Lobosporangium transversale]|nr:hypothetical protein BX616_002440 [Lobosporangium transversale]
MTVSALASPALSESSVANASDVGFHHKAQTNKDQIEQSHSITVASAPSPAASCSSSSSSPQFPVHHSFTPTTSQLDQQHHHLQILGNHPVSPVACTFLDLPEDPFTPARANILFADSEYNTKQDYQESVYENETFMPYSTAPTSDDCQAAHEYSSSAAYYSQQRVKNELSGEQFANSISTVPSTYMMSMARSFSDSQLSDMCDSPTTMTFDSSASTAAAAAALTSQLALNQATGSMYHSSLGYTTSQVVYNDDYYMSAQQHNLYSQQQSQNQYHQHSYSTSPLSSISEDFPLSPRSPFSSSSMSSTTTYPLARTLSEPSIPFFQSMNSASNGSSSTNGTTTPMIKPTPKRSRGRRVSCNPDNSGCKVFTCRFEDCGKIFKRSEHLKRHVRSIHTMEKPFECPIQNCPKRFSRSDNLNQHIRIHRHNGRGDKNKTFAAFTPFLQNYSTSDLLSFS